MNGGDLDDFLIGGAGNDVMHGDDGDDTLYGQEDNDTIFGGLGADTIYGGDGLDTIDGGAGADIINGGAGVDTIDGGADNDVITGGAGADDITGGDGDDILHGHGLSLAEIRTILSANPNVTYSAETNSFYEYVNGPTTWTAARTAANAATINGIAGHLVNITTAAENELIYQMGIANGSNNASGPSGNRIWLGATDTITVDQEWFWADGIEGGLQFSNGSTSINNFYNNWGGGQPNNSGGAQVYATMWFNGGSDEDTWDDRNATDGHNYVIEWDAGLINDDNVIDTLNGGAGNDTIYGYGGADILNGGDGNDQLFGGAGNDTIEGGNGDDFIDGGAGTDTVTYATASAGVNIDLFIAGAQNTLGAGNDTISNIQNITGSNFNDNIVGESGANIIYGLDGDDNLDGDGGNDELYGGEGNDTLEGGGDGIISNINGTDVYYGAGGGGGAYIGTGTGGVGGAGGGGTAPNVRAAGVDGLDGRGSGGSGATGGNGPGIFNGGNGGDGTVIVSYQVSVQEITSLAGGTGNDDLYGSGGIDIFEFSHVGVANEDTIFNFDRQIDKLDLSDLLTGYDNTTELITNYVQITNSGADSEIRVDTTGSANFTAGTVVATINGVTGLTDEAQLEANGIIIIA